MESMMIWEKLKRVQLLAVGTLMWSVSASIVSGQALKPQGEYMTFAFSTSEWGSGWDLLQLLENLETAGVKQVELGAGHAHGIAPVLGPDERTGLREQLEEAGVAVVGMRGDVAFDAVDKGALATSIDQVKQLVRLGHDVGGSGVRVRLGDLKGDEALIEQTATVLRELGDFALGFGQEIRVEVQAGSGNMADLVAVLKAVNHDQVRAAFGVGNAALTAKGVEEEFKQVKDYLGSVVLVDVQQEGDVEAYDTLAKLLVEVDFEGRVLLTTKAEVGDAVSATGRQKVLWEQRLKKARVP
jgi:sugar phosphate isomerase/epimerase